MSPVSFRSDKLRYLAVALTVFSLMVVWGLVLYETDDIQEARESELKVRTETMSRAYGEVVRRHFHELDVVMSLLCGKITEGDMEGFKKTVRLLKVGPFADFVEHIAVLGPEGALLFSDGTEMLLSEHLKDEGFFQIHQGNRSSGLYISVSEVDQGGGLQVSRRLVNAKGEFIGVLVLSIESSVLAHMGSELSIGTDDVLSLVRSDLTLVSRYPNWEKYSGTKLPESIRDYFPSSRIPEAFIRPSLLDGRIRMIAYQFLPDLGLLAGVSLPLDDVRAAAQREGRYWWYLGSGLSVFLLLALWGVFRYMAQKEQSELLLRRERTRLGYILSLAYCGSWERSLKGGRDFWSPSAFEVFGFPFANDPPEFSDFMERVHPDDRERLSATFRDFVPGVVVEIEFRMMAPVEKILFSRGQVELDQEGEPDYISGIVLDLTKSRMLEQSLRDVEKRWQWAVTASRDGVWELNLKTREAWFSPRWMSMLGYGAEEFAGQINEWMHRVHPDDLPAIERVLSESVSKEAPFYELELRMLSKTGKWLWMLSRGQALEWDEDGVPYRFMGTHTDITERKATELALVSERFRLAEAQALAQIGSWEKDLVSDDSWWSDQTYRVLGFQPGEVPPSFETFLGHVHPEDRGRMLASISDALERSVPYQEEMRLIRVDGAERRVIDSFMVQRDEQGTPLRMVGALQDVTDRKRTEESLAESETRYRSLVAAMAEGVLVRDSEGRINFCNDAACRLLGLSRGDLIGKTTLGLCWEKTCSNGKVEPCDEPQAMQVLRTGVPLDQAIVGVERPDGRKVWLAVHTRPLIVPGNTKPYGVVTTYSDITSVRDAQISSQLAEAVVASASQPIVVMDPDGNVVQANPAFCLMAGYELHEIIGQPVDAVMPSREGGVGFNELLWEQLRQQGSWEGEIWCQPRTGEQVPQWVAVTAIKGQSGEVERYVGIYMDITEHKRREERMWRAANYDYLTGLPNRLLFQDRLQSSIVRSRRMRARLGVLFIDLDRFKSINDVHGHRGGDTVLQTIALRMALCVREDDTIARIAGDEFMVLLQNIKAADEVEVIAGKLLDAVMQPIMLGDKSVMVSCSIGYSIFPDDGEDGVSLVDKSDLAMYEVKGKGRNGVARFLRGQAE